MIVKRNFSDLFRQLLGNWGEDEACIALKKRGYKIILRNFRCKTGEIDIIATDKDTLVFVEVKTRSSNIRGTPAEAVTSSKQKHIIRSAQWFMQKRKYKGLCRFDVVAITKNEAASEKTIDIIVGAFGENK